MSSVKLNKLKGLKGELTPPPDKSISHRAVMFAALADGVSRIKDFLRAEDPLSTMNAMRKLGTGVKDSVSDESRGDVLITGSGVHGLKEPFDVLDCGNSGTTMRLLAGILAGNPFFSVMSGDASLKQRPMARVIEPLRRMGAAISARSGDKYPPLAIRGGGLKAMDYTLPVASAQVKSCLMLAGLYAEGVTSLTEPSRSRDHTERMLGAMGATVAVDGPKVSITGAGKDSRLQAIDITVPSDFSSAAFFIAAALITPGSELLIRNVGVNPTRTGLLEVIRDMGGRVQLINQREVSGEPVADLLCATADGLKAVTVGGDIMPTLIDEFPILCILASQAEGTTLIKDAGELRVKESDRIRAMATELRKFGVPVEEFQDGLAVTGRVSLRGCTADSHSDHRIAMACSIAGLVAEGTTTISGAECVDISFPGFYTVLSSLNRG